jgi:hypothetical protein
VDVAAMQRDVARRAARHSRPSSSITATRCPGYGRPMLPARAGQRAAQLPTM